MTKENLNCEILFEDSEKVICCFDRSYINNQKPFYTNKKENYKKAKEYLIKSFTEKTNYEDVLNLVVDLNMEPIVNISYEFFKTL